VVFYKKIFSYITQYVEIDLNKKKLGSGQKTTTALKKTIPFKENCS